MDPTASLARDDKWFLGCGDGSIFAPPFPVWLDAPGFWDEATIYQYSFAPLFTVTLLTEEGHAVQLQRRERRWTPAELEVEFEGPDGLLATETRSVHPGGVFASEWHIRSGFAGPLHLVAWTTQDASTVDVASVVWNPGGALGFTRTVLDRRHVPLAVRAELAIVGGATSWSASLSEGSAVQPHWRFTPFPEGWRSGELNREVRLTGLNTRGLMYAGVHQRLGPARDVRVAVAMRLAPSDRALRHGRGTARERLRVSVPTPAMQAALTAVSTDAAVASLRGASRRRWGEWFEQVPGFTCSDPYFERYYWYRWYGLYLNAVAPGVGNYDAPTMCEGIQFFHQPIAYSAQCHVRELRWVRDPSWARGVLRTFFRTQKPHGGLHGRVYVNHLEGTDYYHANWGDAFLALDTVAPDEDFLREIYPGLAAHADWLYSTRDDGSGMIDVVDQYETGQEYMSRYQAIDPQADAYGWENRLRLKGIDVTVYAYALVSALARLAPRAGAPADVARWNGVATRARDAVRDRMWDSTTAMFSDVDPRNGERTGVRAAVCFYPYFTDAATELHLAGLEANLFDPKRFWCEFPVPSSSLDDPLFSAEAEWKGKRHVCPWNGRVWPMTNSHIVEALGRWATVDRPHVRAALCRLLQQFVRMMFHDGDVNRPNCYEHYNPFTAAASKYRGIDDYQHSWVADLIIQYVAGVRPTAGGLTIDPFPFGIDHVALTNAMVCGHTVSVRVEGDSYEAEVDGERTRRRLGDPLVLAW